jgi:hypothetical protein
MANTNNTSLSYIGWPCIALLLSFHCSRTKKGKEREKLSSFCWPKIPWRKKHP